MPQFHFSLSRTGEMRQAGVVQSESFDAALTALSERMPAAEGDTLEIGVSGFPPARYECVGRIRGRRGWRPSGQLAA